MKNANFSELKKSLLDAQLLAAELIRVFDVNIATDFILNLIEIEVKHQSEKEKRDQEELENYLVAKIKLFDDFCEAIAQLVIDEEEADFENREREYQVDNDYHTGNDDFEIGE